MPIPLNHAGAGIVTLAAPASGSYTLTFPTAVAAGNGYMLSSDTSGNLSWAAVSASSLTATGTSPISFQGNSNTGTYNQTVIYSNQNNTSANNANGIFIERGRLTDSASAEVRYFVIGARGGQVQFSVNGTGDTVAAGTMTATIFYGSAAGLSNFPTLNQNTTGSAGSVTGNIKANQGNFVGVARSDASLVSYISNVSDNETQWVSAGGGAFSTFYTAGSERMRITSTGGLAIGVTTDPGAKNIMLSGNGGTIFANDTVNSRSYIELYNTSTGDMSLATTYTSASIKFLTGGTTTPTERVRIDSSGNLLFNSGYGSVATAYGCRAWVNFNGTGTVAIRGSANVSSLTDNGTGNYSVNYTTAMPDANYAGLATCRRSAAYTLYGNATFLPTSTSAGQVCTGVEDSYSGEIPTDCEWVHVAIFR